jgi:putative heme-binding domain-containing protein
MLRFRCSLLPALLLLAAAAPPIPLRAQLANQPPSPSWLTGAPVYETRFEHKEKLLMAILLVAADREVAISINDKSLGVASDPAKALSLDITPHLRSGTNTLQLRAKDGAPVRAAALLELNGDLASKRWIATDATWTSPSGKVTAEAIATTSNDPAANPFDLKKVFDAYNSWQLAKRDQQSAATDPSGFIVPPGFKVELIRSAQSEEDSWVAMTFDPQGRITLAREKPRGLLRFDPRDGKMELIEDTLIECRGLVYAHGSLFAHANNTKALFRLTDADGDGKFSESEKKEIMRCEGGVGHGRNHIKLGPDGNIWVVNGNNVLLPSPIAETSPLRNYANDQVLPNPWDGTMFDGSVELPAGHVLRVSPEGDNIELIAGGLRNALDIAFNRDGELFTFDADMERDVGTSWYMPTRVLHVVSGADFGWRRGTGRFPSWYVDTLPSVVDIGLASPTATFFGYGGKMPAKYQDALFICDWSYGRIIAIHLTPDGASYKGSQENFITGRPLNVTDGCIGPDGAMWFTTGGRGTQSGLYRVTYSGEWSPAFVATGENSHRKMRRELEAYHRGVPEPHREDALELIAFGMSHPDRFIQHAARVALEQIPFQRWPKSNVTDPLSGPWSAILRALACVRIQNGIIDADVFKAVHELKWEELSDEQRLAMLRTLSVWCARAAKPGLERELQTFRNWLEPFYPAKSFPLNQELCRLLIRLKSPTVLAKTLPLLRDAKTSEELLFYPLHLRYVKDGWDVDSRRIVFEALNRAEKFNGASTFFKSIIDTRSELAAALPPDQATELAAIIHPPKPVALSPHAMPGHTFKNWKLEDLAPRLHQVGTGRSFEKGRAAAISAQCVFCHRMSTDNSLPMGLFGPELVQVSARFSRRDILDHILDPSKVVDEKFRFVTVTRADGTQITGSLESEDDERVTLKPNPLSPDTVEVGKSLITKREVSAISPMPPGLLNALKADQILDLLAFIESGGDPNHRDFKP